MRLLFVTDGITPYVIGGMQRHSENLVRSLLKSNVHLTLIHCVYNGKKLPSQEDVRSLFHGTNGNLEVIGLNFPTNQSFPGHYIRNSKEYSNLCFNSVRGRLGEFDFIYTKGFTTYSFLKNRNFSKTPAIGVMLHGLEMFQPSAGLKQTLQKLGLKTIARYSIVNSDIVFSYGGKITTLIQSIGIPEERIIESPGGIDESWLQTKALNQIGAKPRFLFVGRNEKRKGLKELYEVLEGMNLNCEFHFVGPLPEVSNSNYTYHGEIKSKEELIQVLDNCDVLVCPSHSEGMPNVIMESMSRGLAIIATDVGATSILVSEKNGWLIPPFNKSALSKALLSASEASLMGKKKRSINIMKSFTFDNLAKELLGKIVNSSV